MADEAHLSVRLTMQSFHDPVRNRQLVVIWVAPDGAFGTRGLSAEEFGRLCDMLDGNYWPIREDAPEDLDAQVLVFDLKLSEREDVVESVVYAALTGMDVYVPRTH